MRFLQFPSFAARTRERGQGTVEYGLVVAGGALLALLSYTLFNPIVKEAASQIAGLLPSFR